MSTKQPIDSEVHMELTKELDIWDIIVCKVCTKEKKCYKSVIKSRRNGGKYCSRECRIIATRGMKRTEEQRKQMSIEAKLNPRGIATRKKGTPSWNKGKSWSEEAKRKISKSRKGFVVSLEVRKKISETHIKIRETNPLWRGGITDLTTQIRHCLKYALWRESIQKRDYYTCQKCGKRGGKLHAEHIIPFSVLLYRNKIKSLEDALNCPALWDMNNGKILCVPCHKQTPTYLNRWYIHKEYNIVHE